MCADVANLMNCIIYRLYAHYQINFDGNKNYLNGPYITHEGLVIVKNLKGTFDGSFYLLDSKD